MPSWRRVTLSSAGPVPEDLIARLHESGSLGVEVRGGLVFAYFPEEIDATALLAELTRVVHPFTGSLRLESCERMEDGRWHERWVERLAPIPVGRRFWIVPGVAPPQRSPREGSEGLLDGRHILKVTPGQAFGTGEHPTTRMCLELMEQEIRDGWSLLDVGTGSGILAIGARMLGAEPVVGIDIDEVAVQVARGNAAASAVTGVLLAAAGPEALRPRRFDLLVANLDAQMLARSMGCLSTLVERRAIVSGILRPQRRLVEEAAARVGLGRASVRLSGEWVAILLERVGG